jgi:hypothetical protein
MEVEPQQPQLPQLYQLPTALQTRQGILPEGVHRISGQKAKTRTVEVQYDIEEAGLPEEVQRVEVDTQVSWELSHLDSAAPTAPEQVITDSRTQDSWNYLQQFSSVSETRREQQRQESLPPSFPMAVETLRLIGELISLYLELKEQLKDLDEELAGQTDFEKIQYLITMIGEHPLPQRESSLAPSLPGAEHTPTQT